MNSRSTAIVILLTAVLTAACAPSPERPSQPEVPRLDRAEQLAEAGSYEQAAELYLQAADASQPPRADRLRLRAADWYIEARNFPGAHAVVDRVDRSALEGRDALWFDLIAARVALERAAPAEALALLTAEPQTVPGEWRVRYHRLRAQAYLADRQPFASAGERIALDGLLDEPGLIRENREDLFSALLRLSPEDMQARRAALPKSDPMRGWLALTFQMKTRLFEGRPMDDALATWRGEYPDHPAGRQLADDLVGRYRDAFRYPDQVALLLPLSGRFASAAEAIRDGFMSAYYNDDGERPEIRVYDVASHPQGVIGAYHQALDGGAGWVVGPLDRAEVETLLAQPARPVPVLALNYADDSAPSSRRADPFPDQRPPEATGAATRPRPDEPVDADLAPRSAQPAFQFGLLPEQEARQAAEKLMADGHRRALALAPADEWGERMLQAFVARYTELGGYLADASRFQPGEADHSDTLRALLALSQGQSRKQALQQLTGRQLEFVPHPRDDADALFLAARPEQARLIKPQLRFFQAVNLPVYGTSHLYSGTPAPGNDSDLNGVVFCDAPWMLGTGNAPTDRQALVSRFPAVNSSAGRLFAVGMDAYRLIPYLPWLADHPGDDYPGVSGRLVLDADNRLHRRLAWAEFRSGRPIQTAGPLPVTQAGRSR